MKFAWVPLILSQFAMTPMPVGVRPRLIVAVQGAKTIRAVEWLRAQEVADHIFRRAGVDLVWTTERTCGPKQLCVTFLQARPGGLTGDAAGYTVLDRDRPYAAIVLPDVARTAGETGVDVGTALGAVLAHELGHLLLGANAHSAGVMSSRLDWRLMHAAGRGELLFSDEDARRLRRRAE